MSVLSVIQFKTLANQLTTTEFDQFLSKLTKQIGKEVILKLLCRNFMKSTLNNDNISFLNDMMQIISNIIQRRKLKDIEQKSIAKIDQLPSSLIGEISSYLYQKQYVLFSRSNRSIFVSCNTPNTLKQIALHSYNYSSIPLQSYPQIMHLKFNLSKFHQFELRNNETIGNRLQIMVINGNKDKNIDIEPFMNQNCINFNNLQSVSFENFTTNFSMNAFYRLLSKFSMIKHLDLWFINIREQFEDNKMKQLFPNLNELTLLFSLFAAPQLLQIFGANLECLTLSQRRIDQFNNINNINFSKLQKFMSIQLSFKTINDIFKTAKSMKEICFYSTEFETNPFMDEQEMKNTIKNIIIQQTLLEFLYIPTRNDTFDAICNSIESALYQTKHRKREYFEIVLEMDPRKMLNITDFIINISRIINVFNVSKTNNFMLSIECDAYYGSFDVDSMLKAINDYIELIPTIKLIKATCLGFIIGNKHCVMHRHCKWWNKCRYIHFYTAS